MRNMGCRHVLAVLGALLLLALDPLPLIAAPGSWQGQAAPLRVARSDRRTCSEPLVPPPLAHGRQLAALRWSFRAPAGNRLQAWLCHGQRCAALPGHGGRGRNHTLAGLDAGQSLRFCFRLAADAAAETIDDLQLLVDYR